MSAAPLSSALQTNSVNLPLSPCSQDDWDDRLAVRIDNPSRSDAWLLSTAGIVPSEPL